MRRVLLLSAAIFFAGTACLAAGIGDFAIDMLHGYSYTASQVTQTDAEGRPHIYPRKIDGTDCANLDDARKALEARAEKQLADIVALPTGSHASVKFVFYTPKALLSRYAFTPNYPAQDEIISLMDTQGRIAEKLFADALRKSEMFGTVSTVESDQPADEPLDGAQYKIWLDNKLDGKPVMAFIIANDKGQKRPVQVTVGYGLELKGLPEMVGRMTKAVGEIPVD